MLHKYFAQIGEGEAGVKDVFHDEDVFAFDRLVEVLDELYGPRGALALAVAGDSNEVECSVDADRSGEIGEKDCGAFENTHHYQFLVVHFARDLRAHFGNAVGYLLTGIENLESPVSDGGHGDSIAREGGELGQNSVKIGVETGGVDLPVENSQESGGVYTGRE